MRHGVTVLAFTALLAGCASMDFDECRHAQWTQAGYDDGARGASPKRADEHAKACAEYGVTLDRDEYMAGYGRGLAAYCTRDNAVKIGLAGGTYGGVCPPEAHGEFVRAFEAASSVRAARGRLAQLGEEWRRLEYNLERAQTDEERRYLRYQLLRLDEELRRERARVYYQEAQLQQAVQGSPWP